jgi:NAD(P)-dependent dehydrogenase (short-subunit alcohol dehydrogenase family)
MTDGSGGATEARFALFDLADKVAIVTGSTKGLGRAMVEGLARAGAAVVVSSRHQDMCDEVAKEIERDTGARTLGLACNVGDWEGINVFVDEVVERLGRIDVLVNNAGISPGDVTPSDMTLDYWQTVFSVNLEGPLRMSQCVAPVMRDVGGGSIIHIGTMAAYHSGPTICAYGASKAALKNLTRSMAMEWAPWKVRVNMLSPGPFTSELLMTAAKSHPGYLEMVASATLQGRVADPWEIVGPVLYLATDASSYVTADDISVSGGMRK